MYFVNVLLLVVAHLDMVYNYDIYIFFFVLLKQMGHSWIHKWIKTVERENNKTQTRRVLDLAAIVHSSGRNKATAKLIRLFNFVAWEIECLGPFGKKKNYILSHKNKSFYSPTNNL